MRDEPHKAKHHHRDRTLHRGRKLDSLRVKPLGIPIFSQSLSKRALHMFALVLAGEAVFVLPFHVARFFRPSVLEVFDITATELGAAQGVYGVIAMLAYFPGGPLADRFPAHKLMAASLFATAAGGLYMATFPGYLGSAFVWGFFGLTTILLFWAALIRATRDWGGVDTQGRAFGWLDGGRGLLGAVFASLGVYVFALAFPDGYDAASAEERADALRTVIYGYTTLTVLTGIFVWFALADLEDKGTATSSTSLSILQQNFAKVLRIPAVWCQAGIVICAYVAYKGLDNFSLYTTQVYGMDEVDAAALVAWGAWMRPVGAIAAGYIGDFFRIHRVILAAFAVLLITYLWFGFATPEGATIAVLTTNFLIGSTMIYALRGLYFALFEDARVPAAVTGTAVGVVSVIGYTPEIFVALVAGIFIDSAPGLPGHQNFFLFQAVFAALGILIAFVLGRLLARQQPAAESSQDRPA